MKGKMKAYNDSVGIKNPDIEQWEIEGEWGYQQNVHTEVHSQVSQNAFHTNRQR